MSIPLASTNNTTTTTTATTTSTRTNLASFSFESISTATDSSKNSRSNSINSLLYFNSSTSSMGLIPSDSDNQQIHNSVSTTTSTSNLNNMSTTTTQHQQETLENTFVQHQTPTLSMSSYTLQRPPGVLHDYTSSISSVSSTTSSNSTTSPMSPGLINYSPKHSRKLNSLTANRNMKNLSLNLHDSTNGYTKNALKLSAPPSATASNNKHKLSNPSIDSPIKRNIPMHNNFYNLDETALQTPSITETPTMPPILQQAHDENDLLLHSSGGSLYKFPPIVNHHNTSYDSSDNNSDNGSFSMKRLTKNNILPPAPPPFALNAKSSPLSTPPRLQSPLGIDKSNIIMSSPISSMNQRFNNVSINSPIVESSFDQQQQQQQNTTPQNLVYTSKKLYNHIPEELQESTSINAYPNGPRSVLNNLIYLYSDPIQGNLDINQFNLVINVAKECKDLTSFYKNSKPNFREYVYIPWSHNSLISKDLFTIINKIESFYNKGLKILIHCQCGVSRSACVIVAFFMKKFQMGVNEAYELLKNGNNGSIEPCDRICPNMSLIFELMEFGDKLNNNEISTQQLLMNSPPTINI